MREGDFVRVFCDSDLPAAWNVDPTTSRPRAGGDGAVPLETWPYQADRSPAAPFPLQGLGR